LVLKIPERLRDISPLDGTKEFFEGLLDCVILLIGIAVSGEAVAGVIGYERGRVSHACRGWFDGGWHGGSDGQRSIATT
jgi:3'-phosphoadenosine 5'-phosphosulfate (PAPS) 3'-phosphatase